MAEGAIPFQKKVGKSVPLRGWCDISKKKHEKRCAHFFF